MSGEGGPLPNQPIPAASPGSRTPRGTATRRGASIPARSLDRVGSCGGAEALWSGPGAAVFLNPNVND